MKGSYFQLIWLYMPPCHFLIKTWFYPACFLGRSLFYSPQQYTLSIQPLNKILSQYTHPIQINTMYPLPKLFLSSLFLDVKAKFWFKFCIMVDDIIPFVEIMLLYFHGYNIIIYYKTTQITLKTYDDFVERVLWQLPSYKYWALNQMYIEK